MFSATFAMIKPDATERHLIGAILARLEAAGFTIHAIKITNLTVEEAGEFYAVHRDKPFHAALSEYMASGPIVPLILARYDAHDAVTELRRVIGATDPAEAEVGTLRREFGQTFRRNSIHGSDSAASAACEMSFFFDSKPTAQA